MEMFSNDRNIETIAQLIEVLKHYIGLQTKYMKLDVIDKVVRLMTVATMTVVLSFLVFVALIYLSFGAVYAMEPVVGTAGAFFIIAGFYILAFALCIVFRKQWIEKPIVRVLANILMQE